MTIASRTVRLAMAVAALAALSAPALAQGTEEQRSACMSDAFKFCAGDIPNVQAIEACLVRNDRQLSPACAAEFRPAKKSRIRRDHFAKQ
jgi:hypothetical protein